MRGWPRVGMNAERPHTAARHKSHAAATKRVNSCNIHIDLECAAAVSHGHTQQRLSASAVGRKRSGEASLRAQANARNFHHTHHASICVKGSTSSMFAAAKMGGALARDIAPGGLRWPAPNPAV